MNTRRRPDPSGSTPFEPATAGDSIALKTDWSAFRGDYSSFGSLTLKRINPHRYELIRSWLAFWFAMAFLTGGCGISTVGIYQVARDPNWSTGGWVVFAGLVFGSGGLFALTGLWLLVRGYAETIVFEKEEGYLWTGSDKLHSDRARQRVKLTEIYALQLLSYRTPQDDEGTSHTVFELNLVLRDASRISALCHGHRQSIWRQARNLGDFLDVPVWGIARG